MTIKAFGTANREIHMWARTVVICSLLLSGCASMLTTPQKDCRAMCLTGKVESYKSDTESCVCREAQ